MHGWLQRLVGCRLLPVLLIARVWWTRPMPSLFGMHFNWCCMLIKPLFSLCKHLFCSLHLIHILFLHARIKYWHIVYLRWWEETQSPKHVMSTPMEFSVGSSCHSRSHFLMLTHSTWCSLKSLRGRWVVLSNNFQDKCRIIQNYFLG